MCSKLSEKELPPLVGEAPSSPPETQAATGGRFLPVKWISSHYTLLDLRTLVYFADAGRSYDPRMEGALGILREKRRKDGTWQVRLKHPGKVHFEMEKTGGPSRFNTLRALRVLRVLGMLGVLGASE